MSLTLAAEPMPLRTDTDGVVRIGSTRVTLDTIVGAFRDGTPAETIADQYPSLSLAEVYAVIGYYLRHQPEVEAYLREREQLAKEVRQQNEVRCTPVGVRDRLLAGCGGTK
jgi:uncharacterized protein (DUF433 family)